MFTRTESQAKTSNFIFFSLYIVFNGNLIVKIKYFFIVELNVNYMSENVPGIVFENLGNEKKFFFFTTSVMF